METLKLPRNLPLYSKMKAWGFKPLVVDFYVQRVWPSFSLERIFAKVRSVRPTAKGIVTICLKPNFNFKKFQAGQHVLVTTAINGHRMTRTYSPTRLEDGTIEITVKHVPGGRVSGILFQNLKRGSLVEISAPFGAMTWSQLAVAEHFDFCAGGVGITPLRSLIHAWDLDETLHSTRAIDLHYWAKTDDEHCFVEELREIASRRPNFHLHLHSRAKSDSNSENNSRFTLQARVNLKDVVSDSFSNVVVACGPKLFVQNAQEIALIRSQRFFGEHASSSAEVDAAAEAIGEGKAIDEKFFDLTYDGKIILASSNKTILESLEDQGFEPPHGCRMGLCKSCTCLKRSGTTRSTKDQSLSTEDSEEIQICVATPRSPIILERY